MSHSIEFINKSFLFFFFTRSDISTFYRHIVEAGLARFRLRRCVLFRGELSQVARPDHVCKSFGIHFHSLMDGFRVNSQADEFSPHQQAEQAAYILISEASFSSCTQMIDGSLERLREMTGKSVKTCKPPDDEFLNTLDRQPHKTQICWWPSLGLGSAKQFTKSKIHQCWRTSHAQKARSVATAARTV